MPDLRQELMEQHRYGPDTYIGQLCLKAAEEIRILGNEVSDLRAFGVMARDNARAVLRQTRSK